MTRRFSYIIEKMNKIKGRLGEKKGIMYNRKMKRWRTIQNMKEEVYKEDA